MTNPALAERYGRRFSRRRVAWTWTAGVALVIAAVVAWFAWANPLGWGPSAHAQDTAFHMSGDAVTVDFTLTVTPGRASACAVQALDKGFSTVGWRVVTFPAGDGSPSQESVTLRVIAPANTGLVSSCWLT